MRLIDADDLEKYMDNCGWCDNCPNKAAKCSYDCDFPDYCTAGWERVIDEQPTIAAPRWVRCEERLPENKKHYYLVCTDMGYMCSCRWTNNVYGFRESDEWGWSMIDVPQYQKVTHWMPIEPPKEECNAD